ncbi:hypothetical protein AVEN_234465-1 [Araneus ventricosus]|uniref:Reverse transcriptase domain-containing protein n=1 Tax=Araneus ventricosus TaxID=182803 RepID=A0A4Y2AA05_ARAVE|nr:hypothetical protein AVEN_234465-1 [Araneus ventricosus]
MLFGVNSSPFMLAATIKQHLRKYQEIYTETSEFLNNCIYADDIIGGHQNAEDARIQWRTGQVASLPDGKWAPLNRRQCGPPGNVGKKKRTLSL